MFELRVHVESLRHDDGRRWRAKVVSAAGSTRWITVPHLTAPACQSIPPHAAASWADFLAHCAPNETKWTPPPGVLKEVGAAVWRELLATADFPAQLERARARAASEPLRVALVLEDDGGEQLDAALFDCPFELAYRTDPGGFVFHSPALPAVRVVSGPDERNAHLGAGARVAIVTAHDDARPEPTPEQLGSHASSLEAAVRGRGWTPVLLPGATPADVERLLRAPERLDVLYVVCHGEDDPNRSGRLALRGGDLTGERLGALLAERTDLRLDPVQLVVLVACSSARPLVRRWSAGMAEWVARCGRAVAAIGFQADMSVAGGLRFGEQLLRGLCDEAALEPAFAAARRSVPEPEWALPLLYTRLLDRNAAPPDGGRRPRAPELPPLRAPLPRSVKPTFTGRERELAELRASLERSETAVVTSLEGQGGIGKSELAAVLAHEARAAGREVVWLERPGRDLRAALVALLRARTPDLQVAPERSDEDLALDLRRELGPYDGLLVLDDVEAARDLDALRPGAGWSLLVTTRQPDLVPGGRRLELGPLSPAEALTLLSRVAWGPDEPPAEHRAAAEELVETLGRVPLHLELAGATLRTSLVTPGEYRAALLAGTGVAQTDLAHVRARVFEGTLAGLGPAERETFLALGVFPACGVRAEHVAWGFDEPEPVVTRRLDRLVRHRLVAFSPETGRYGLHPLARAVARETARAEPAAWDQICLRAARLMDHLRDWLLLPVGVTTAGAYDRWSRTTELFDTMNWEDGRNCARSVSLSRALSTADMFRQLSWTPAARLRAVELALDLACGHAIASAEALHRQGIAQAHRDPASASALEAFADSLQHFRAAGSALGEANVLRARADLLLTLDHFRPARTDLGAALRLYRDLGDRLGQAETTRALGTAKLHEGDRAGAAADFEEALLLAGAVDDPLCLANVLLGRGHARQLGDDLNGAVQDYEAARLHFARVAHAGGQAHALCGRGSVRKQRSDLVGASQDYEEALALYSASNDVLGTANALRGRGDVRLRRGELDEAEHDYSAAAELHRQRGNFNGLAADLKSRGDVHLRRGDLVHARRDYKAALALHRQARDPTGEAAALLALGDLHLRGDLPKAASAYERALTLFRTIGSRLGEANVLSAQGHLLRAQGSLRGAIDRHTKALELHASIGDQWAQARDYENRGNAYADLGDGPDGQRDLASALEILRSKGDNVGEARATLHLGKLKLRLGDIEGAESELAAALKICDESCNRQCRAEALTLRGVLRLRRDDVAGALRDWDDALTLYAAVPSPSGQATILMARGHLAKNSSAFEEALRWYSSAEKLCRVAGDTGTLSSILSETAAVQASTGASTARRVALEAHALALRCGNQYALRLAASVVDRLDPPPTAARAPNPAPTEG